MTLDDLIKNIRKSGGGSNDRGEGRGSGPGPSRRFPNRNANRSTPYSAPKVMANVAHSTIETGTKLYISNLDYGVCNEDIKELFAEVGDLTRYSVHYDRRGRSKGTAEAVFSRQQDALSAVKRYNNVRLDGKPMKIEIVGADIVTPASVPTPANGDIGILNEVQRRGLEIILAKCPSALREDAVQGIISALEYSLTYKETKALISRLCEEKDKAFKLLAEIAKHLKYATTTITSLKGEEVSLKKKLKAAEERAKAAEEKAEVAAKSAEEEKGMYEAELQSKGEAIAAMKAELKEAGNKGYIEAMEESVKQFELVKAQLYQARYDRGLTAAGI